MGCVKILEVKKGQRSEGREEEGVLDSRDHERRNRSSGVLCLISARPHRALD